MYIMTRRFAAVEDTIAQVRAAEALYGVTPAALAEIKGALVDLARAEDLFPPDEFTIPDGAPARLYRLAEDADHRFALYAAANRPGRSAPPHNHTTWAAIAGVRGREHNVFYQRVDNGEVPGEGRLQETGALTVVSGNEETGGRLEIVLYPSNQLGSDTNTLSQVRAGAVELFSLSAIILSTLIPETAITGVGFAFKSYDQVCWSWPPTAI
jgi:predicted metal-dependent enzyme (double-stranded beta helix superfamily)